MCKKGLPLSCLAWILAAGLGAGSARALMATALTGEHANFSWDWYYEYSEFCGYFFYYKQRVTVGNGPSQFVAVDALYRPGHKDIHFIETCADGTTIYGVGSCECAAPARQAPILADARAPGVGPGALPGRRRRV